MLIQDFLDKHSINALDNLNIEYKEHPTLPLIQFNYNMFACKTSPIVQECRGLVLEKNTWNVVARTFPRFFNVGEVTAYQNIFNWNNYQAIEKIDGSLCIVYWYGDDWHINTRGSFSSASDGGWNGVNFATAFKSVFKNFDMLCKHYTYLFEFVSPQTRIVTPYSEPDVYLLGMIKKTGTQLNEETLDVYAHYYNVKRPQWYSFTDKGQVEEMLSVYAAKNPLFEGFVLRDNNNYRLKLKSKTYCEAHTSKGNGLPTKPEKWFGMYLDGSDVDYLSVFPEYGGLFEKYQSVLDADVRRLNDIYSKIPDCNQKKFAEFLDNVPGCGILFTVRKMGKTVKEVVYNNEKYVTSLLTPIYREYMNSWNL